MPSPNALQDWQAPDGLADGAAAYLAGFGEGIRPDPALTVSQWSDRYRVLSSKASSEAGPWRTERTPYLREIMDCLTPSHPMTDGALQAGTQLGKSEALYNWIGYVIDQAPGPAMLVNPTTDMAKRTSKQRIAPMIDESPRLRGKVREAKSRNSGNTTLLKEYDGGLLIIAGANSGPGLRSSPVRYLLLDEIDAYPIDVDGEGDPVEVAAKRTDTFGARAKRMSVSTPKLAGSSNIDRLRKGGSGARYYVPCPHCAHEQYLRWGQMRWDMYTRREMTCTACGGVGELARDAEGEALCQHCDAWTPIGPGNTRDVATAEVARAWYECEACGGEIGEQHKPRMLAAGRWIHATIGPCDVLPDDDPHPWALWAWIGKAVRRVLPRYVRPISWHLPALYSPLGWFSWAKACQQYVRAQAGGFDEATGEPLMQVFANTVLAEAYESAGDRPPQDILKARAETYRLGQVPRECLMLVGFVDVQGDRLEALCLGFGRDGHRWVVDHQRIYGNTLDLGPEGPWERLTAWRNSGFAHAGGSTLRIWTCGIDSGYQAHTVYAYAAAYRHQEVFATKGMGEPGRPLLGLPKWVDVNHRGKKIPRGAQLWHIGTDTAKDHLYRALNAEDGYGVFHFPAGLPDEFWEQLTAERLHRRRVGGREVRVWELPSGRRNEILDLVVGCLAAGERAGVRRIRWDDLEARVNPAMRDLFAAAPAVPAPEAASHAQAPAVRAQATDVPPAAPAPASGPPAQPQARPRAPVTARRPRNFATGWRQ